jgi:hypothetical protein
VNRFATGITVLFVALVVVVGVLAIAIEATS